MKTILLTLIVLSGSISLVAQEQDCKCCTDQHKAFDFWIGKWDVYSEDGKLLGTNIVNSIQDHCVIEENWTSKAKTLTGTSFNFYDSTSGQWKQLWLDNHGYKLELSGNFEDGSMKLRSETRKNKEGQMVYDLITWTYNMDGTVTQVWTLMTEKHEVLSTLFTGIYKPSI
ncbi:MAG: hypothetical protein HKN92_05000 [Chitinophagales bacterium]|nr:hypothetical protein [Chitinophagales bacterium]